MSESKRYRIVKRKGDGAELGWTPLLEKNPEWRSGWKTINSDGTISITLDTPEPIEVDNRTQSEIEQLLMEENAKLKDMLREMGWDGKMPGPKPDVVANATPAPTLEPGESPLLSPEQLAELNASGVPTEISLQAPQVAQELPLDEAPTTVEKIPYNDLKAMPKERLIVRAHQMDPQINLPDGATKKDLIKICSEMQKGLSD